MANNVRFTRAVDGWRWRFSGRHEFAVTDGRFYTLYAERRINDPELSKPYFRTESRIKFITDAEMREYAATHQPEKNVGETLL